MARKGSTSRSGRPGTVGRTQRTGRTKRTGRTLGRGGSRRRASDTAKAIFDALGNALSTLPDLVYLQTVSMADVWGERFHSTESHELIHVLEGSARVKLRSRSFAVRAGDTFIIPRGVPHKDVRDESAPYRVIMAHFRWPSGEGVLKRLTGRPLPGLPAAARQHLRSMMKELEDEHLGGPEDSSGGDNTAAEASERMRLTLLEVILALLRYSLARPLRGARPMSEARTLVARERRRRLAQEARGYLVEHCGEELGLEALAREFRVTPFHLSRTFSREFGRSITDTLTEIRIDRAKELLSVGPRAGVDLSVKEVAAKVGFASGNYFAKVFRRVTGLSPSEYQLGRRRGRPGTATRKGRGGGARR